MSNRVLLIGSLALMIFGVLSFTLFQTLFSTVTEGGETRNPFWIVPLGYFALLIGAFGLSWAWFRRRKIP